MLHTHEFPILEHSTQPRAILDPVKQEKPFPPLCLLTFFEEVLVDFVDKQGAKPIGRYRSEMKEFPIYQARVQGVDLCLCQAVVGSAAAAMQSDYLFGKGVDKLMLCGAAGVLEAIPEGEVLLPVRALRDEGASYHYLAPSRYVEVSAEAVAAARAVLTRHKVPFAECTTWTTDGFYRETEEMVEYRRREGCLTVEMECAAVAAVAQFRGKVVGQLLYSGDVVVGGQAYDDRGGYDNMSAREKLFTLALESAIALAKGA